jgi:hypothetical protein
MQQTKTTTEARPRRSVQVVPSVPSRRARLTVLIGSLLLLLFVSIRFTIAWNNIADYQVAPWVENIWHYSLLSALAPLALILALGYLLPTSSSRELEQKRQQAARYNMTVGAWERALARPRPDLPALPDSFTLASERNWSATLILGGAEGILMLVVGAVVYAEWHDTLPLVQQGAPLFWVLLNTAVNIALFLGALAFCLVTLIFSPRQRITATSEGLFCRRGYRTSFIPWQDAQLFAVIGQPGKRGQPPVLIYELASKETVIRWSSSNRAIKANWRAHSLAHLAFSGRLVRRSPLAACSFEQQIQALNIIVAERSGLPLYDLS